MMLIVEKVEGTKGNGGSTATSFLLSDVRDAEGAAWNDNMQVTLRAEAKNPSIATTPINSVTLTRYHVEFKRADGRNRPGVDVPYGFDGALSLTITPGGTGVAGFEVVRHQSKFEPPLSSMVGIGGFGYLSTYAEVTIYGRDQNGNELSVIATMDVHFGDFSDADAS